MTPVSLETVILGEQFLCLLKSLSLTLLFFVVGVLFGVVPSTIGMLVGLIPLAAMVLCIIAMGHLMCGWARVDYDFDPLWPLIGTPMMLISGIFYPVSQLPEWVQSVVWLSPLYHGVEAFRPLVAGHFDWNTVIFHTAVLLVTWGVLTFLAMRRLHKRIYV